VENTFKQTNIFGAWLDGLADLPGKHIAARRIQHRACKTAPDGARRRATSACASPWAGAFSRW
jgi:hypothetical protein